MDWRGESGEPDRGEPAQAGGLFEDVVMALRFFSRLPTGDSPHRTPDIARMAPALPFASLLIGLGPALLLVALAAAGLPPLLAATLAVAAAVLAGGAMAEDALADSADGLFGGGTPERRLEIMKDSRHGSYGVAALCLFLVARVAALGSVAAESALAAGALWLAAGIVARSAGLWPMLRLPPARTEGAGAAAGQLPALPFAAGAGFAALLALVLAGPFSSYLAVLLALVLAALVAIGWTALCRRLVGGQTGDLAGGLMALCEIAALTGLLLAG